MQDIVIKNAKKLKKLSDDVLDVTRIESQSLLLQKENFNLNEMILSTIAEYNNQINKKIQNTDTLKIDIQKEDIFLYADKSRVNQVITNLLNNAIKFTTAEGKDEWAGQITITINKKDNHVVVSIKDTGKGIDQEILPRLFKKFVTKSKMGGIGLGLFISKSIVEAHGGKIWAENNKDEKGAIFSFSLPIY